MGVVIFLAILELCSYLYTVSIIALETMDKRGLGFEERHERAVAVKSSFRPEPVAKCILIEVMHGAWFQAKFVSNR